MKWACAENVSAVNEEAAGSTYLCAYLFELSVAGCGEKAAVLGKLLF
jgi:hypothetical protein